MLPSGLKVALKRPLFYGNSHRFWDKPSSKLMADLADLAQDDAAKEYNVHTIDEASGVLGGSPTPLFFLQPIRLSTDAGSKSI